MEEDEPEATQVHQLFPAQIVAHEVDIPTEDAVVGGGLIVRILIGFRCLMMASVVPAADNRKPPPVSLEKDDAGPTPRKIISKRKRGDLVYDACRKCQWDEVETATVFCETCNQFFCDECGRVLHKKPDRKCHPLRSPIPS